MKSKVDRVINNINVKLDNLQEKLRQYDENSKHIIMEESERGEIDTSKRIRHGDSSPIKAEEDKTIEFEKLSQVSS